MSPFSPLVSVSRGQNVEAGGRSAKKCGWAAQGLVLSPLGSSMLNLSPDTCTGMRGGAGGGHSPYHPKWARTASS